MLYIVTDNLTRTVGFTPYYLAIYFDHFDNSTDSWKGKVMVPTNGGFVPTINFTFYLGSGLHRSEFVHSGFDYLANAYSRTVGSLEWSAAYPGSSLIAKAWEYGTGGAIFLVPLNGTKMISVGAGTFNCTELLNGNGKTWINKDLPFPVKGFQTGGYEAPGQGVFHTYMEYDLLQIGTGMPSLPEFHFNSFLLAIPLAVMFLILRRMSISLEGI